MMWVAPVSREGTIARKHVWDARTPERFSPSDIAVAVGE
jgi:hypothetical protein